MIYIQLIYNLSMLIALSVLSGFVGKKDMFSEKQKSVVQGIIFGMVAVVGMLYPVKFAPGVIFDGRSVVISLCALFFGPVAVAISAPMAILLRLSQGGVGSLPGILVILEAAVFGLIFHYSVFKRNNVVYVHHLLLMGIFVHVSMVLLMFTLPDNMAWKVVQTIGLPVILIYPIATILIGKIISDNLEKAGFILKLKENEEKYRKITDNISDVVWITDLNLKLNYISPSIERLTGFNAEIYKNQTMEQNYTPDSLTKIKLALSAELENEKNPDIDKNRTKMIELEHYRSDDSTVWISMNIGFDRDIAGNAVGLHGVSRDITEQKRTIDELNERVVQFHNLANSSSALIWTSGTDKLCFYFNDTWLKFTGRTTEQEKGNGWAEGIHPDDFDRCLKTYVTAFDKREKFEMEYRLRNAKGEYRWLLDIGTPNYDAKGEFIGYIGHCFDIDDKIRAGVEEKKKNEELRQMNSLMVDREIKMTELKQEINGLLKELGREPKY